MAVDFGRLTAQAIAAAKRVGATASVTLTRPAPPPNPLTGVASGVAVSQAIDGIAQQPARLAKRNAAFLGVQVAVYCAAETLTFAPQVGDQLLHAGRTVRVSVIEEHAPAGTIVGYFLGAG